MNSPYAILLKQEPSVRGEGGWLAYQKDGGTVLHDYLESDKPIIIQC